MVHKSQMIQMMIIQKSKTKLNLKIDKRACFHFIPILRHSSSCDFFEILIMKSFCKLKNSIFLDSIQNRVEESSATTHINSTTKDKNLNRIDQLKDLDREIQEKLYNNVNLSVEQQFQQRVKERIQGGAKELERLEKFLNESKRKRK